MKHLIEFRTTISPTSYFFRRVHFMAASLRVLKALGDHEIIVSVGGGDGDENYYRSHRWSNLYPILWRQVPTDAYAKLGYRATNRDRASSMSRAEFVMLVDADVVFLRDFSDLMQELRERPAIAGVMAHVSPFANAPRLTPAFQTILGGDREPADYWQALARHFGASELALEHQLSGWGIMHRDPRHRFAPAYFNGGMVLGNSSLMEVMFRRYAAAEAAVDEVMESYFCPQIARTLAMHREGLPYRVLPLRYNFPNDPAFDQGYPDELASLTVLHYLRHDIVHRDENFVDAAAVDRLVARTDLMGSNERLRQCAAELREAVLTEEGAGR